MRIALAGNPNTGKSTLFNRLTGLRQKVGNFPGVTVEKKTGSFRLLQLDIEVIDLPGTYSLYPGSKDESVATELLINPKSSERPDLILLVADASNLKRHLLLFTQIKDLGFPIILVLNQYDVAQSQGIEIDVEKVSQYLQTVVVPISAKSGFGLDQLKQVIAEKLPVAPLENGQYFINTRYFNPGLIEDLKANFQLQSDYLAFYYTQEYQHFDFLEKTEKAYISDRIQDASFVPKTFKSRETLARYEIIGDLIKEVVHQDEARKNEKSWTEFLDQWLIHRLWGYVIFFVLLLLIFQAIYSWASYPQDFIEQLFGQIQLFLKNTLPAGLFTDLLVEGVVAGLGGIVIFIPQIAILFIFISALEESGYMSRVMFIMDRLMRHFGLNGKSVVPLVSGIACAVPAIMAARSIESKKERLITVFVTPLMSCSARLPVYAILIALVVPEQPLFLFFNLQGITLMGMYLLGFVMAILTAWVMKGLLREPERSVLIMELPPYKFPNWYNIFQIVYEKVKVFVLDAGKIILAISIILWVLSSYGPSEAMQKAEIRAQEVVEKDPSLSLDKVQAAYTLEASYAGQFGKWIEPVIAPLGYDWKIGIALLTSFAAREVFVGTLSTIYAVNQDEENLQTLRARMREEINPRTGKPLYNLAVSFSLLVFYAFAMQCMSTLAIVYRETQGWKWPLIQLLYLSALAYLSSFLVYNLLS